MPCVDGRENDYQPELEDALRRNDMYARYLCSVLGMMSDEAIACLDQEVRVWWQVHKAQDTRRREHDEWLKDLETHRQTGLAKLSADERRALGVR